MMEIKCKNRIVKFFLPNSSNNEIEITVHSNNGTKLTELFVDKTCKKEVGMINYIGKNNMIVITKNFKDPRNDEVKFIRIAETNQPVLTLTEEDFMRIYNQQTLEANKKFFKPIE